MQIKVKELVSENAMTWSDGAVIHARIHAPLRQGQRVELDFDGVKVFGAPFFNACVGQLLGEFTTTVLYERLTLAGLSEFGARVLRRVMESAEEYYAMAGDQRRKVERIVRENAISDPATVAT